MQHISRVLLSLTLPFALVTPSTAQSVTLFGQSWQVQRFDYKQQVTWPNPVQPGDTLGLLRVESAWSLGGGHMMVGTSHQNQSPNPTYANYVLEISWQSDPQGSMTGLSYVRTVVENDLVLLGSPFELRPNGLAINPSASGIGAGNGLLVLDGFGRLVRSYDSVSGAYVPYGPSGDGIDVSGYATDPQDLTIVIDPNPSLSRLYVLDEPTRRMYVHALDGTQIADFPVSGPANPAAGVGDPKGLAYLADDPTWPESFHAQGGVLLVSLGDAQPGLQAFRTDGVELGYEPISNAVFQTSSPTIKPKIESMSVDPATGRLFLFMEKGSLVDNWVWVLTPDCNSNHIADALEIQGGSQSDLDQNGVPDSCQGSPGTEFCFGDGSQATSCPCNNFGAPGRGCQNSAGTGGAHLRAMGTTSPDNAVLVATGEKPTALTIFLQGTASNPAVVYGDGLRCVDGTLKRIYTHSASGGTAVGPQGSDLPITVRSAQLNDPLAPGSVRHYMAYYRDGDASFCPSPVGSTFNATNAITIAW